MVTRTTATTTAAAKRKKTDEMADSPPKRVTRARTAKATEDSEAPSKTKKSSTKAPAAKAVVDEKKAPAKTTGTQKKASGTTRRTRKDAEVEAPVEEPAPEPEIVEELKPKSSNVSGTRKRTVASTRAAELEVVDAPKPRGRKVTAVLADEPKPTTTKTRSRPKRSQAAEPGKSNAPTEIQEPVETMEKVKQSRAATKSDAPKTSSRARTAKKVQFQEDLDKENVPLAAEPAKGTAKSALKATGIRAKPVRKPAAATRTTTRGRRGAKAQEDAEPEKLPLSPKKMNQVAKFASVSSEDELIGEKTPIKSPSKSPMKDQTSRIHVLTTATAPSSPSKSVSGSILASPSRRPPSPFKDGLTMSPRKVEINFSTEKPVFQSALNNSPAKSSLLQESPRKIKFTTTVDHQATDSLQSPMKTSLLQSPARRPLTSPFKSQPQASSADFSKPASPIKLPSPPKPMRFSPQQAASSPLRAAKSPTRTFQVHKITPQAQEPHPVFKTLSPDMVDSPCKTSNEATVNIEASKDADVVMQDVEDAVPVETPEAPSASALPSALNIADGALRRVSMESGSTDELASPDKAYAPTPLRKNGVAAQDFGTPTTAARAAVIEASNDVSFTPLVGKLGGWMASSPNKMGEKASRRTRGVFSLGGAAAAALKEESPLQEASPVKTTFFEDELAAMDDELNEAQEVIDASREIVANGEEDARIALQSSMESQASEEYGDENAAPTEAELLREEQDNDQTLTCTPAKVFTPAKAITRHAQEIHTVSKVPLRASMEHSPLKVARPRSKSLGGPLSAVHEDLSAQSLDADADAAESDPLPAQPATPKLGATIVPQTPSSGMKLDIETPGRTVHKGVVPDVLKGAIVYVDVHTSEGADASGIFVDLLTQMGARCVKQWNWNPRASVVGSLESTTSPDTDDSPSASPSTLTGRVGITHVVYKDGGKRTLEKVRQSKGVVLCVGVGWVLDCEREEKWLDEANYAIDTSIVPRGGGRRRKSMEPRALANLGGNLIPAGSEMSQTPASKNNMSPTKEFLAFNTPASRRDTFVIEPMTEVTEAEEGVPPAAPDPPPTTPKTISQVDGAGAVDEEDEDDPNTPYYLSKHAQLIQRTCPPKQGGERLFPTGKGSEDEQVQRRLLEARRKSMAFASKTRSPLGRTVSFGVERSL